MFSIDHECDMAPEQDEISFIPGKGPFFTLNVWIRRLIMASEKNPESFRFLRSRSSIMNDRRRHLRHFKHVIHPFSIFRHIWSFTMVFALTILIVMVPYQATFELRVKSFLWFYYKNILLFVCCCDITFNCMTGYFDRELQIVEMDQRKILHWYAKHTLIFDVLGSFPTDLLFITVWNKYVVAREVVSLICGFRAISLSIYIGRLARAYNAPLALYEFCIVIYWLMIFLHWQSCLYWIVPIAATSLQQPKRPRNDSWLHDSDLWETSDSYQYKSCILRAIATFLRSGFLHAKRTNSEDIVVIMVMQLLGAVTSWSLIARAMQFFKGANSSRLRYQSTVAQLKQYMRHKQLPRPTQRRIMTYYEFRFQNRYFRESEILGTLSPQMRQEIGMHSCRKLVENVTFFNNLPLALLGHIVALLRPEIFLTNDVIVRAKTPGNCMYFIASGTVAIYTSSGKEVCHLEDGAHFGEIALMTADELRVASVVAVEVCELYRLDRADFARTIHPYPMLWDRIKKIAIERHEKTAILNAE